MHCKYFATSNPSDMDDLAMTCSGFENFPKMLIYYEKHPVSRANNGYHKSGNREIADY